MKRMRQPKKFVVLAGNCNQRRCKKRSVLAKKIGRYTWVEFCEEHKGYIDRMRPKP